MNAITAQPITHPAAIGAPMEGGHYIGAILLPDGLYGIAKAPKALGDFADMEWGPLRPVPGALSFVDGRANTLAMAEAGSELAKRILALRIADKDDWYLPALDEIEVCYRAAKPGTNQNYMYMRSGINLHSIPPSHPYTADDPAQTAVEIFRNGSAECFEEQAWYWSSTQYASASGYAWFQHFGHGSQNGWPKDSKLRGCAVRRFKI